MATPAPKLNDKALQEYYDSLFETYGTPGWKALMEDVQRMHDLHNTTNDLTSIEQLWFRKGELHSMQWLLGHQNTAESAFEAAVAEQEGTDEAATTGGKAKLVS